MPGRVSRHVGVGRAMLLAHPAPSLTRHATSSRPVLAQFTGSEEDSRPLQLKYHAGWAEGLLGWLCFPCGAAALLTSEMCGHVRAVCIREGLRP